MGRRPFAAIAAAILLPVVVVLTLSDRAPTAGLRVLSGLRRVGNRVLDRLVPDHPPIDVPIPADQAIHLLLWAAIGLVTHRLVARRLSTVTVMWLLIGVSFAFEVAQVLFTTTRDMEAGDIAANVFGVLIGVSVSHLVTWMLDRRSARRRATRRPAGARSR